MARPHFRFLPGLRGLFFKVWVSGLGFGVYGSVFWVRVFGYSVCLPRHSL